MKVKTYWLLLLKFISLVQLTLTKNDQLIMSAGMSCYFFWWHFLTDSDILYLRQYLFWNCPVLEPLLKHLEVTLLNNDSSAWRNYHFKFSFGPVYIKSGFWKVSFFAINISSNISWMWVIFWDFRLRNQFCGILRSNYLVEIRTMWAMGTLRDICKSNVGNFHKVTVCKGFSGLFIFGFRIEVSTIFHL